MLIGLMGYRVRRDSRGELTACAWSPVSGLTAALTLYSGSDPSPKEKLLAPPGGAMTWDDDLSVMKLPTCMTNRTHQSTRAMEACNLWSPCLSTAFQNPRL